MRVALQVVAVLERAGLALVGIDRQQPGGRFLADELPFHPRAEPRSAQPRSPAARRRRSLVAVVPAARQSPRSGIRPARIGVELEVGGDDRIDLARGDGLATDATVACSMARWPTTATGADSHRPTQGPRTTRTSGPRPPASSARSRSAPEQRAGQAVADPDRPPRRAGLAVADDVEVGVERGDLVDLGQRQAHLLGQGGEVALELTPVGPGSGAGARSADRGGSGGRPARPGPRPARGIDDPPLGEGRRMTSPGPRMDGSESGSSFVSSRSGHAASTPAAIARPVSSGQSSCLALSKGWPPEGSQTRLIAASGAVSGPARRLCRKALNLHYRRRGARGKPGKDNITSGDAGLASRWPALTDGGFRLKSRRTSRP